MKTVKIFFTILIALYFIGFSTRADSSVNWQEKSEKSEIETEIAYFSSSHNLKKKSVLQKKSPPFKIDSIVQPTLETSREENSIFLLKRYIRFHNLTLYD